MRALIVSPDYASHYLPLSALGRALQARGHEVVVATGPALAGRVHEDGFEHRELVLGPGNNPGLIRTDEQPSGEGGHLDAFIESSRRGMIATLRYQAESRLHDLLWRPRDVTSRLHDVLADVEPTIVVCDQLAFGATLALRALRQPYVSFHPGHPSAIPGLGELYGFPHHRPREFAASDRELSELRRLCSEVSDRFTRTFNATLRALDPDALEVASAFSATSPILTLLNYPSELGGYRRALLPPTAHFIGASVRHEPITGEDMARVVDDVDDSVPRIYVSLGSFFSGRSDVLQRIVSAFRARPVQLIVAAGVTPRSAFGDLPESWHVLPYLPQPAVLRTCDLAICHGGNNTVTEALWAGVPLLVCPFSTDQFAGAEDVRRAGLGDVFDPNATPGEEIAARGMAVLASAASNRASRLGMKLRLRNGPALGSRLIENAMANVVAGA